MPKIAAAMASAQTVCLLLTVSSVRLIAGPFGVDRVDARALMEGVEVAHRDLCAAGKSGFDGDKPPLSDAAFDVDASGDVVLNDEDRPALVGGFKGLAGHGGGVGQRSEHEADVDRHPGAKFG